MRDEELEQCAYAMRWKQTLVPRNPYQRDNLSICEVFSAQHKVSQMAQRNLLSKSHHN